MNILGYELSDEWVEDFWEKVDKSAGPDACWVWRGNVNNKGYGRVFCGYYITNPDKKRRPQVLAAHRVSHVLNGGTFTDAAPLVLHACHNRVCVNPKHLRSGDNNDNSDDRVKAGRQARGATHGTRTKPETIPRGSCHWKSKVTEEQVRRIREEYASGQWTLLRLGEKYGIHLATIRRITTREIWAHVP